MHLSSLKPETEGEKGFFVHTSLFTWMRSESLATQHLLQSCPDAGRHESASSSLLHSALCTSRGRVQPLPLRTNTLQCANCNLEPEELACDCALVPGEPGLVVASSA